MSVSSTQRKAVEGAARMYVDDPDHAAHGVHLGEKVVAGRPTGQPAVVVVVPRKLPEEAVRFRDRIHRAVTIGGERLPFDVQEAPPQEVELLRLSPDRLLETMRARNVQQACHSPLVPGGAQIQPEGATWLGTLGCMMIFEGRRVGAITNAHVTGLSAPIGKPIGQPDGRNPFAKVLRVAPLDRADYARNLVDLGLVGCINEEGRHTISPELIGLGRLSARSVDAELRLRVAKSGRTTGVTRGRCIGVAGIYRVGYGGGLTLRFVDLDVFGANGDGGRFSQAGDSGSAIVTEDGLNFTSLLFAGGGGQTLGCPARHVLDFAKGTLYG